MGGNAEGSGQITGLRDRKRERNRGQTAEAAWRLFIERGYDNVTVADICAAAEIAPRTFHRYFASKDDVIAEPVRHMTALLSEQVSMAAADLDDAAVLRAAFHELGVFVLGHTDWLAALRMVIEKSSHLRAIHLGVPPERELELTAMLAARGAGDTPGWRRKLLVACEVAAFRIWYDDYLGGAVEKPLDRLDEMLASGARPGRGA